jgi:hypothetical protein
MVRKIEFWPLLALARALGHLFGVDSLNHNTISLEVEAPIGLAEPITSRTQLPRLGREKRRVKRQEKNKSYGEMKSHKESQVDLFHKSEV